MSMKSAMQSAGLDVSGIALEARALEALKNFADDPAAASVAFARLIERDVVLREALCLDYLRRALAARPKGGGHRDFATPLIDAAPTVKVAAHKRRSWGEKRAARGAMLLATNAVYDARQINGRPIGDISWGELKHYVRSNANDAASYLRLGTQHTEDALLLDKIMRHCAVDNDQTRIRDAIKPGDLERYAAEARTEAPRMIETTMHIVAARIEQGVVEHAI